MSLFAELRRRNVFKVGLAYIVSAWVLLQVVDLVLDNITAPEWVMQVFMLAVAIGFPFALIFAWAFEMTPDGIRLEKDVDKSQSISKQTGQRLLRNTAIALAIAVILLLVDRFRDESVKEADPGVQSAKNTPATVEQADQVGSGKSIAVLPFRDMSAGQDQAYFGEGIAEELLNALVKIDGLEVASRTSAFSLADDDLDIPSIAARLGVSNILEGSIRTSGNQVRVTAQLIDVGRDAHLWSETYDGTLDDIFQIQDEITAHITTALKVHLGEDELVSIATTLTSNPQAYQLYLQGRHLWRQRNSASLHEAVRLFSEAVVLDPEFHQAWSNLAVAFTNLPDYDGSYSTDDSFREGLKAAEKALQIYPQSTEALIIKANYHEFHCGYAKAAELYENAIAFNTQDPTAHHWYAIFLGSVGRTALALKHIQAAHRIDPLISAVISIEAELNQVIGNYARAEELHRSAASLGIDDGSLLSVAINHLLAGNIQQAREIIEQEFDGPKPEEAKRLDLLVNALEDPAQIGAFMAYVGTPEESDRYALWDVLNLLTTLGSAHTFEFQAGFECPVTSSSLWVDSFEQQRGTAEFFDLMQRAGVVEYWREFGWPDDCASLDQTLAECP